MSTPREDIEQYLRRATRGLWGRRRREVREELLAHIDERVLAHRIGGSCEAAAVANALAELGPPSHVREGMIRLHSLPTLAGLAAALAVACVIVLTWGQSSVAQKLTPSFTDPTSECLEAGELSLECFAPRPWLSVEELRRTLEPQGVGVTQDHRLVKLNFPGGNTVTLMDEASNMLREERIAPGHLDTYRVLHEIVQQSGLPVTLQGWKDVSVQVGDVTFDLDLVPEELDFYMQWPTPLWGYFYWEISHRLIDTHLLAKLEIPDPRVEFGTFGLHPRATTFDVAAGPRDVYALVAFLDAEALGLHRAPEPVDTAIAMDISPANDDRSVTLDIPDTDLTWVGTWPEHPTPGTAMLVRLTAPGSPGQYGHEIIDPSKFSMSR